MKFTKMQGAGNDYIYVNCFEEKVDDPCSLSKKLSDRHFGIGGDGLILICPSDIADFRMRMFNSMDGSEGDMCGNAIRCVGKYVFDRGMTQKNPVTVETLDGIKVLHLNIEDGAVRAVRVDMGEPRIESKEVPVASDLPRFIDVPVNVDGRIWNLTAVSVGNPHAVTYVDDVEAVDIEKIGPRLENHPVFPKRANIEFVQIIDDKHLRMRVWERGSGETLACGTGSCATLVASALLGKSKRHATVILRGGELDIDWSEKDNRVYMTGPAETVFEGEITGL